jgi:defect in organelle trafficking protein DotD
MKKLPSIALLLLLSGCSHKPQVPANATPIPVANVTDDASTKLAEAAASVSQSLNELAAVDKANMAPKAAKLYPHVAEMQIPGTSSIDWNGPIQPLLTQIAKAAGYRLVVSGHQPSIPIIVLVRANQRSNADIVRDATLQATNRASVRTDYNLRTIYLTYQGN